MTAKKIIFFSFLALIFLIFFNIDTIRSYARQNLPSEVKIFVEELFFGEKFIREVKTYRLENYNQKILPETQFEELQLSLRPLKDMGFLQSTQFKKFFIEVFNNDLLVLSHKGKVGIMKNFDLEKITTLDSNLEDFNIVSILDVTVINKELFVSLSSYKKSKTDECAFFNLLKAPLEDGKLIFESFYETKTCLNSTLGGRIKHYNFEGEEGLLLTTAATENPKDSDIPLLAQDDKSPYGKILFFNIKNRQFKIFSKGHRNPQGLIVDGDVILSTEHGPYGGDEINKIVFNGNYGFPIVSHGDSHYFNNEILKKRLDYKYKKSHSESSFIEPIFTFLSAIGISEIEKIPNDFSKYWQNNYLISSLNGRALYRILFDDNFTKVIYLERIPVPERVRDLKYIPEIKSFILAFESSGSLGLLSLKK